jgi:hypothetical protein
LRDRIRARDAKPAKDYVAVRDRWQSLDPKTATERAEKVHKASAEDHWAASENFCRTHYVGEALDILATDYAYSRLARVHTKETREEAERKAKRSRFRVV